MKHTPPWLAGANTPTTTRHKAATAPDVKGRPAPEGWLLPVVDKEPSLPVKLKLEEFARQYIIDFNQTRAAVRLGYDMKYAAQYGNEMFWRPYTQAFLTHLIRTMEETTIVGRNEVLAGLLREANRYDQDATSNSRIAAWAAIGKILGMFINRIEISANSSGVMEVPMVTDSNQWESVAAGSQNELMKQIRE